MKAVWKLSSGTLPKAYFYLSSAMEMRQTHPEYSFNSLNTSLCNLRKDHKSCKPFHAFFFSQMPEDLTKCQDSSHQQHCGLGRHNPTPAGGSQTLFPRAASGVSFPSETNCIGRQKSGEKGAPVAGSAPCFPQRRHQSRALGRGAALNSGRAAPKPQGTGTGTPTWDGLSAACPTSSSHQQ